MGVRNQKSVGYTMYQANDRRVTFGRATERDRVRGKILFLMLSISREVPALNLNKGSAVPKFIHEPNDKILGMQLTVELGRAVAEQIPEIRLTAVQVDRSQADEHTATIHVVYRFKEEINEEDRFSVPLSMWGVT